jgi:hypothetical protein
MTSFLRTKKLEHIQHFVCIDALPKVPHYDPGQRGYNDNKDEPSFLARLDREVHKKGGVKCPSPNDENHVVYIKKSKTGPSRRVDYYYNMKVEDAVGDDRILPIVVQSRHSNRKRVQPSRFWPEGLHSYAQYAMGMEWA